MTRSIRWYRCAALLALIGFAAPAVAGCGGSALSPEYVQAANRGLYGVPAGTQPGTTTGDPATLPGQVNQPGATTTSGPGASGPSTPGASPGGNGPAAGAPQATSCAGFKNQTGIDAKNITIGTASDVSGPIPGLFAATQLAVRAYAAYFNATSSLCGRKLRVLDEDTRTDAGADQSAYTKLCDQAFAGVGSMATFDSGGAPTAQRCGLPDLRTAAVTSQRNACSTCFAIQSTGDREAPNVYDYWIQKDKAATQHAAFLYLNAGAAAENARTQIAVGAKRGMKWLYTAPIDVAEFNYGPYVQQMKSKGIQFVQFIGAYQQSLRMIQAMRDANFNPGVRFFDSSVYDPGFLKSANGAADGIYLFISFVPLESSQPELNLYKKWLQQVSPGAQPTFFGLFAWSAAKLFVTKAAALGGKLSRPALISALRATNGWTGGGMHAPMAVGTKHPPSCYRYMTVRSSRFVPYGPTSYLCNGYSRA